MSGKRIFPEALISLRHRLSSLPSRSKERSSIMQETANLYGVSESTLYRALNVHNRPKPLQRSDCGKPRILPADEMEMYCEIIAAMKIRTSNKKCRHLSTSECIRLLQDFGLDTPSGFFKADPGQLKKTTVNQYLKLWDSALISCLQIMWAHSHLIRAGGVGYSQIIWAENADVCRSYGLCLQAATDSLYF